MNEEIELIAGYWTLAGDTYPFAKSEVSPFPLRNRIEAAASAGYKGIGLLHVDLMAAVRTQVARGGIAYTDVATLPTKRIVSVELDDADAQPHGTLWEDTLHHRRLCGEGALRPREFIAALHGAGYRGVYSVEIISREHRKRALKEAALRAFETTMNQFGD